MLPKMKSILASLTLRVRTVADEDVVLIFAEPTISDLDLLLKEQLYRNLLAEAISTADKELCSGSLSDCGVDDDEVHRDPPKEEDDGIIQTAEERLAAAAVTNSDYLPIEKLQNGHFRCKICHKTFNYGPNARKHVKVHGVGLEPVGERTCPQCDKIFRYATLCKLHIKRTCQAQTTCNDCHITFETRQQLRDHVRTEHSAVHVAQQLSCSLSSQRFSDKEKGAVHSGPNKKQQKQEFQCGECAKKYKSQSALKLHVESVHHAVRFACPHCQCQLSNKQALDRHVRNVHEVTSGCRVKCPTCSNSFKDKAYLTRHIREVHQEQQLESNTPEPCPQCGKLMPCRRALQAHVKRVHDRNFRHTCEDCGKSFPYLNTLQIHAEMAHLKGVVHVCQICGKECIGRKRLHNHVQRKHPKGQKFVPCQHCHKEFPTTQLKSHVYEAHKMAGYRFQCAHCPKKFETKAHIKVHTRKHTKARPYLCRGCGQHWRDLLIAKKHIRLCHAADYSLCYYDVTLDINNPYTS